MYNIKEVVLNGGGKNSQLKKVKTKQNKDAYSLRGRGSRTSLMVISSMSISAATFVFVPLGLFNSIYQFNRVAIDFF